MALIVETGAGYRQANALVNEAFVTAYLAERNRSTENSWDSITSAAREASIVAATDYMGIRFEALLLGQREFTFDATYAEATIIFAGLPVADETLLLGDQTYTFKAALTGEADEVLIGADATATADNLADAVNATAAGAGVTYGTGTTASRHSTATSATGTLTLTATAPGSSGSLTALTGPLTNTTINAFSGGLDGGIQPLIFPRRYIYDQLGTEWRGVPLQVKQACAEYAVRAAGAELITDPVVDTNAGIVVRKYEKVGPIEEATDYQDGSAYTILIKPYPAADRLMKPFIRSGRGVIR